MNQGKTIKEQIGILKEIQVIDKQIYALKKEKDKKPEQIKVLEKGLEDKKIGIKQAEERLKGLQLKLKNNEMDLQQKEEQIKKLEIQLYQLKSNKEYSAMLLEIQALKADNSQIEEEIIKLMDVIEIAKKDISKEREIFNTEEANTHKEKDIIHARIKEIESNLSKLSQEREKIVPNIEKKILARYERVLENRAGLAIVQVVNGACGGCHMNLPPQVVSEAKLKEDIVVCGSCSRILYVDDDVEIS